MPRPKVASRALFGYWTTRHLLFPDVAGNRLFQSYQNMDANPHVGLIFFIPGVNDTVRVNGTVTIADKEELERRNIEVSLYEPDDRAMHLQGIIIEVDESYGHCPRALTFSPPVERGTNRGQPGPATHFRALHQQLGHCGGSARAPAFILGPSIRGLASPGCRR